MTPDQAVIELDEAFARRDLAGVLAFYEDDAVVVELTRFRGHLNVRYGGVYGGANSPVHAGV
jgi:ketosteroid isomerase-like protein